MDEVVKVIDVGSANEEEHNDVNVEERPEWDYLEINTENDDNTI